MALVELDPAAAPRAGHRSKRGASPTSAPTGGGGESTLAAASPLGRLLSRPGVRVWAPLALRAFAVLAGMIALAAIGASSIARGSGAPVPPASGHAAGSFVAGGFAPLGAGQSAGTPAQAAGHVSGGSAAPAPSSSAPNPVPSSSAPPPDASAPSGLTADGKVILNRANSDELTRLPGVGKKRAEAIVALRQKLGGRFKRLTDLLRVKGIGTKGLKKMEGFLVLDG